MPGSEAAVNGKYGTAVRRREDPPLIQGTGTYTDDVAAPGALHAQFVRSEVAHGRIVSIETAAAAAAPGVAGVFTGADLDLGHFPPGPMAPDDMLRPTLARDVVRFQGEAIAVVVAETKAAAVDAAELVEVDIEPLDIVVDPERALDDDAPQLFPDKGSNLAFAGGSADEGALEGADVVVRSRYVNQRLAAVPMEPSAAVADARRGDRRRARVGPAAGAAHRPRHLRRRARPREGRRARDGAQRRRRLRRAHRAPTPSRP